MRDNRGFVLISLLALWPIILSILVLLASSALYLKTRVQTLHFCRSTLLEIQKNMAYSLDSLLALNPKAQKLRAQEAKTIKKIKVAAVFAPKMLPILEARLLYIRVQQLKLSIRQKMIIKKTEFNGATKLAELKKQIPQIQSTNPKLAVYATPAYSLSPDYETVANFSSAQKINATWTFSPNVYLDRWLLQFFDEIPNLDLKCSATIKEVNNQWKEKLAVRDKF